MFTFIDHKTGVAFNGEQPYVFWFEQGQSTNLNYVRQICIYTDSYKLSVTCDSPVFSILKMDQLIPAHERVVLAEKKYIDLSELKTNQWVSTGYKYRDCYVHMLYILANSNDAGEYIDVLRIDADGEYKEYSIGADFYNMNEILQANLENRGIELPESIQKAIYEKNLHEEANDNILLNRKYKELLMNYMSIVANKGSYQSLVNSLKWFEWGDLVEIKEYWKRIEPHKTWLLMEDLMSDTIRDASKTTYIGLYYALQELNTDQGDVIYNDTYNPSIQRRSSLTFSDSDVVNSDDRYNIVGGADMLQTFRLPTSYSRYDYSPDSTTKIYNEVTPELKNTIGLWNNLDLCLKMTLLGNFYSTFFMPIHVELLHSTIESLVFTNVLKILSASQVSNTNLINLIGSVELEDVSEDHTITSQHTYVYNHTLFKSNGVVSGCSMRDDPHGGSDNMTYLNHFYSDKSCIVHLKGCINEVLSGEILWKEVLKWSSGERSGNITDYVTLTPVDGRVSLDFRLRIKQSGTYKLYFEFYSITGKVYTKTISITIKDDFRDRVEIYRVVPVEEDSLVELEGLYNELNISDWATGFWNDNPGSSITTMSTMISTRYNTEDKHFVGLTHTVVIPLDPDKTDTYNSYRLSINTEDGEWLIPVKEIPDRLDEIVGRLKKLYWVYLTKRHYRYPSRDNNRGISEVSIPMLVCIKKRFATERSMNTNIRLLEFDEAGYVGVVNHDIFPYVDEYRFYPILHRLESLDDIEISADYTLYIKPVLHHAVYGRWEFRNTSTLKSYYTKTYQYRDIPSGEYLGYKPTHVSSHDPSSMFLSPGVELTPGYYDIILHYMVDNVEQSYKVSSAFLITQ